MNNFNFVFLILHYLTYEDTKKCVESILSRYSQNNVKIVIVDNCSNNGSGEMLLQDSEKNERIAILLLKENLGFAKGNNVGFQFAKTKWNADFIIMINNDVFLMQNDFLEQIISEYEMSNFAVLGPKIILKNNKVNEIYLQLQTVEHYQKDLTILKYEYFLNKIYIYPCYKKIRNWIRKLFILLGLKKEKISVDVNKRYENIVLHGSALIFSKKYIECFDGLDDRTFLYREEELLFLRLRKNNLKNVYNPKVFVFHNEDSSTNALTKKKRRKRLFIGKNLIQSTQLLILELKKEK